MAVTGQYYKTGSLSSYGEEGKGSESAGMRRTPYASRGKAALFLVYNVMSPFAYSACRWGAVACPHPASLMSSSSSQFVPRPPQELTPFTKPAPGPHEFGCQYREPHRNHNECRPRQNDHRHADDYHQSPNNPDHNASHPWRKCIQSNGAPELFPKVECNRLTHDALISVGIGNNQVPTIGDKSHRPLSI